MAEVEVGRLVRGGWDELPDDTTKEKILARLPLECLCRSKAVSKVWNALFSCLKFITKKWAEEPPNKKPWLILCDKNGTVMRRRFCFFTRTWKNCPRDFVSFFPREHEFVRYAGSAEGLFLVYRDDYWNGQRVVQGTNTVCNPLTRTFLQLPPMSSINEVIGRGIVSWKVDTDQETYKVVFLGRTGDNPLVRSHCRLKVEIYDSYEKSWGVVRYLPDNLRIYSGDIDIVFRDDFFYCILFNPPDEFGVLCYSIVEGTSTFTPLPSTDGTSFRLGIFSLMRSMFRLLICGSRIVYVSPLSTWRMGIVNPAITEVTLWEFQRKRTPVSSSSSSWKEIARMPPSLYEVLRIPSGLNIECVGVEDCVCFANYDCKNIAVYNLEEDTWSWLPNTDGEYESPHLMAFKPRPDIRV